MKTQIKKKIKQIVIAILLLTIALFGIVWFANWNIAHVTKDYVFKNIDSIPSQKVALVLGAAKTIGNWENPYFTYRMQAASKLYHAGKVQAFVLSGDNSRETYNEPEDMRNALIAAGVPDSIIYLDYAGLRTLDSIVRMNKIFGQDSFLVVSQKFHNERAVFLAQYYGYTAYGYNAKDLAVSRYSFRTKAREKFARVKVFMDILINKQPKFLGETIEIK